MLNELLRSQDQIRFSQKFDELQLLKNGNKIIIEKIKTGKTSWIYFICFLLAAILISIVSHQWLVYVLAYLIAISTGAIVFLQYKTEINLDLKKIIVEKKIYKLKYQKEIPFSEILDFKIKEGEIGHYLKIQIGENLGFVNRIKNQWTLCRVHQYQDCVDLLNWIREIIKPK